MSTETRAAAAAPTTQPRQAATIPEHIRASAGWRWLVERLTRPLPGEGTPHPGDRHEEPEAA